MLNFVLLSFPLILIFGLIIFVLNFLKREKLEAIERGEGFFYHVHWGVHAFFVDINEFENRDVSGLRRRRNVQRDSELFQPSKVGKKKQEKLKRKEDKRQYNLWREQQRVEEQRKQELKEEEEEERLEKLEKEEKIRKKQEDKKRLEEQKQREMELELIDKFLSFEVPSLVEKEEIELEEELIRYLSPHGEPSRLNDNDQYSESLPSIMTQRTPAICLHRLSATALQKYPCSVEFLKRKIMKLIAEKKIQGFFNDKDRFIPVSNDYLKQISNFIESEGRVSLYDLIEKCNQIVQIESSDDALNLSKIQDHQLEPIYQSILNDGR